MIIWIVEDDAGYRRNLRMSLEIEAEITVERVFPSCIELFEQLETEPAPDMILMDLGLPGISGTDAIERLSHIVPEVSVMVLTVFKDKKKVESALAAGAAGYLLKESGGPEIIQWIKDVYHDRVLEPPVPA